MEQMIEAGEARCGRSVQTGAQRASLGAETVVFENDPAFPVFTQSFGKSMSDTLAEAAFGGTPGLAVSDFQDVPPPAVGSWANKKLGLIWSADAQKRVGEAPAIIRLMILSRGSGPLSPSQAGCRLAAGHRGCSIDNNHQEPCA